MIRSQEHSNRHLPGSERTLRGRATEAIMEIRFYNSLTRSEELFEALEPDRVRIYSCGPTVYDHPHLGNWRANIFVDLLKRYLLYRGYQVKHVMNITDVDDKTIRGAREAGVSLADYTEPFIEEFQQERDLLRISPADVYPRATAHIDGMVRLVEDLQARGLTYDAEGGVYYSVGRFPEYGTLSGIDISGLQAGARVDVDEYEKEEARDFVLWKARKPEDGEVHWDAPFGEGRPGWHLECSAMSAEYLGVPFDIHTGGIDLLFPHHENEIAQTWGATGERLARFWMHNEHLIVDGRKMSKSLGNFITLQDLLDKGMDPVAIRYMLLGTHYRQLLNFRPDGLDGAAASVGRIREAARLWSERSDRAGAVEVLSDEAGEVASEAVAAFTRALDDDLNISEGLAAVFDMIRQGNALLDKGLGAVGAAALKEAIEGFDTVLAVLESGEGGEDDLPPDLMAMIMAREEARSARDWIEADRIRDVLLEAGISIEDTPDGTRWKRT
ncbi:cysteine--tRNA ligase [Candidatus Zixiibacteriota bacterium]